MTPAETPKVGDWCWHIHHEVLIEKLTEPFETRKAYIKAEKPEHEVEKRLRLMKPASKKASEARAVYDKARSEALAVYYKASSEARAVYHKARTEAGAVYDKARPEAGAVYDKASSEARAVYHKARSEAGAVYDKARSEAGAVYDKARAKAWAKVEALHQKECPSCPWNGRTIFPRKMRREP